MNFKIVAHTDIGIKKNTNQDSVLIKVAQTDYGKVCFASVCDGMGGLSKGELASATLIRRLSNWFENEFPKMLYQGINLDSLKKSWGDLVYEINHKISSYGRSLHVDMGTTMVLLLIIDRVYYIANVGDSRVYSVGKELTQLTKDQTFIQREVEEGRMTWEEAKKDPRRNVLLQCVGASPVIEPDYYTGDVESDTLFMLCSDGFRHLISKEEIFQYLNPEIVKDEKTMQDSLVYLTDLNKYRNEVDNISSVLVRCE